MGSSGRRRESVLWPLVVLGILGALLVAVVRAERATARRRVEHEDAALAVARSLAQAQHRFHERSGRYGWLEELRDAGLVPPAPPTTGYRFDVLLPTGRAVVGEVPLGTHAAGPAEPSLAARHFAVVARPMRPGEDGFRTWYVDEEGTVFLSEGVSDVDALAENPLPPFRVTRARKPEEPGLVWRRLDALED